MTVSVHRWAVPLMAAALVASLAGCGRDPRPAAAPTTKPPLPESAPHPDERCGVPAAAQPVILETEDRVPLAAAQYGGGHHVLILVHQRGSDLCGWAERVPELVALGLQVLAIDLRCHGFSECPPGDAGDDLSRDYAADVGAAVAHVRAAGAAKVAVMGASLGAAVAFVAAGRYPTDITAVVGLSLFSETASVSAAGVTSASDAAEHVTAATLLCLSTGDASSIQKGAAERLIAAGSARDRSSVVVRSGGTHGWDMLADATVEDAVVAFLKANV